MKHEYRLSHFSIVVKNAEESLKFYEEKFGMRKVRERDNDRVKIYWVEDPSGSLRLELLQSKHSAADPLEYHNHIGFRTEDYQEVFDENIANGTACSINDDAGVHFIQDPDGHYIEIAPFRDK